MEERRGRGEGLARKCRMNENEGVATAVIGTKFPYNSSRRDLNVMWRDFSLDWRDESSRKTESSCFSDMSFRKNVPSLAFVRSTVCTSIYINHGKLNGITMRLRFVLKITSRLQRPYFVIVTNFDLSIDKICSNYIRARVTYAFT